MSKPRKESAKKKTAITTTSETLGCKKLDYEVPDTSSNLDTLTQLEVLRDSTDDDSVKAGLEKLSFAAQSGSFENPITEEKFQLKKKIFGRRFFGEDLELHCLCREGKSSIEC